jgi:hypothetical protein
LVLEGTFSLKKSRQICVIFDVVLGREKRAFLVSLKRNDDIRRKSGLVVSVLGVNV